MSAVWPARERGQEGCLTPSRCARGHLRKPDRVRVTSASPHKYGLCVCLPAAGQRTQSRRRLERCHWGCRPPLCSRTAAQANMAGNGGGKRVAKKKRRESGGGKQGVESRWCCDVPPAAIAPPRGETRACTCTAASRAPRSSGPQTGGLAETRLPAQRTRSGYAGRNLCAGSGPGASTMGVGHKLSAHRHALRCAPALCVVPQCPVAAATHGSASRMRWSRTVQSLPPLKLRQSRSSPNTSAAL